MPNGVSIRSGDLSSWLKVLGPWGVSLILAVMLWQMWTRTNNRYTSLDARNDWDVHKYSEHQILREWVSTEIDRRMPAADVKEDVVVIKLTQTRMQEDIREIKQGLAKDIEQIKSDIQEIKELQAAGGQ